ncbi:MAG: hypothetical protein ABR536_04435 [Solirubrobacterales bacterium]
MTVDEGSVRQLAIIYAVSRSPITALALLLAALGAATALIVAGKDDAGGPGRPRHEAPIEGPAATEAAPEAKAPPATTTATLSPSQRSQVAAAVNSYIAALDAHDAGALCALFAPGALRLDELPRRRGGCEGTLAASIGLRRPGGVPRWKSTRITELKEVSVGDARARVTATVTHTFADRNYASIEDDVIYLDRVGDRWLLAKASGTLYRAVGYPEPPLRALTPPRP